MRNVQRLEIVLQTSKLTKHRRSKRCNASMLLRSRRFLCPRIASCHRRRGDTLTVPTEPAQQTSDDQEFLMNTQDIVETWRREAIQEGVKQGERKLLLRQLRRRFGAEVDAEIERRTAAAPAEQIEVWAERVLSAATLAEVLAD